VSTTASATPDLGVLARPSGGFAMLALDQREAMRAMFAEHQGGPVHDEQITAFKLAAARILSPEASAVLVDRQFALDRVIDERAVDPGAGLIAAADRFTASGEELVAEVDIDEQVDPDLYRTRGVVALKLLVIYRPDGDPGQRIAMVDRFVRRCRDARLLSIVEPVSRRPLDNRDWDWDEGVIAAATELGDRGADLYKAEVPRHGLGSEREILRRCARLTELIASPWVVLSSGVPEADFPRAVELACKAGASGFLAGRAVWQSCIGQPDLAASLRNDALPRLRRLGDVVDKVIADR
jgi:sulfofructosephosphate aldolase